MNDNLPVDVDRVERVWELFAALSFEEQRQLFREYYDIAPPAVQRQLDKLIQGDPS